MNDIEVELYDVNYIPDYVEAEEQRQANEAIRQENEQDRIALYNDLEYKKETDYWRGEKGDRGESGVGLVATVTLVDGQNVIDKTYAEMIEVLETGRSVVVKFHSDFGDDTYYTLEGYYDPEFYTNGSLVFSVSPDETSKRTLTVTSQNNVNIDDSGYVVVTTLSNSDGAIPTCKAVKKALPTDATSSKAGIIKPSTNYGLQMSSEYLQGYTMDATGYGNADNALIVCKGTLENVLTAKGYETETNAKNDYAHTLTLSQNTTTGDLTVGINNYNGTTLDYGTVEGIATRDYVDDLVGDIGTALDLIQGEVI